MKGVRHEMISASAGSGKTYELVRRYLHLLALGVEPERIAAMTFTRKAAGEFFNRILRRLGELSEGSIEPAAFFAGLEPLPQKWPDFVHITRELLRHMHRLRLGTLDSFFAGIAACFPIELGLPVGATVMAEDDTRRALDEALDELMDRVHRSESENEARTLLEAYKLGTYGREDKSVLRSLRGWIASAHQLWLESPSANAWGQPRVIWPAKKDSLVWQPTPPRAELLEELRTLATRQKWSAEGQDKWSAMLTLVREFQAGMKVEKPLAELLEKCAEQWSGLQTGSAVVTWMRLKTPFSDAAALTLVTLIRHLATLEYFCRCERTQGVAGVIAAYEDGYHRLVRQNGRLSFSDVQRLLADDQAKGADGLFGAAGAGSPDLWYRLDTRHDHWLFDEFQDTSVQQWQVVSDLVDEVMQDTSGRRSFFAVGDTKQSIYMWRRAEPGLFRAVESRYALTEDGRGLHKRTLARSHRSCQQVLDAVNATFDDKPALEALLPGCFSGWEFEKHESAKPHLAGHAALLHHAAKTDDDEHPKERLIAALLQQIQPTRRGLTCAVLVKGNNTAASMADYLRGATGMDVVSESHQHPATDNPVTLALLSVLQLAAHPGDTFALEHLRMTPLGGVLEGDFKGGVPALAADTLRVVQQEGFAGFVERWSRRIEDLGLGATDAFARHRLAQLADIASEFDESGDRRVDVFLNFARDHGSGAQGSDTTIQVMTIHKSKGLEFDVVILPDLDGNGLKTLGPLGLVKKQELFGAPQWILQMPADALAKFDPTLCDVKEQLAQREGFEGLCRLYVAMTRAKLGLYMISKPPPKTGSGAASEARVLRDQLTRADPVPLRIGDVDTLCAARIGDADWYESHELRSAPPPQPAMPARESIGSLLARLQPLSRRVTPSDEEAFQVTGATLFAANRESGRGFGSLVHALLAEVDWADDITDDELRVRWQARGLDLQPDHETAARQVLELLRHVDAQRVFARPRGGFALWRERSFDLLHKGGWVSGIMDRAVISLDAAGNPTAAWLIDFKTDAISSEAQRMEKVAGYKPQVELYLTALRKLTGLPAKAVSATLVFTRSSAETGRGPSCWDV